MTEVLRHDNRNKFWYTQEEVVDKIRHSSRCGDTDEDVFKNLIREVVTHGTPDASRRPLQFSMTTSKRPRGLRTLSEPGVKR